jgi:hypothetical protein
LAQSVQQSLSHIPVAGLEVLMVITRKSTDIWVVMLYSSENCHASKEYIASSWRATEFYNREYCIYTVTTLETLKLT